MYYNDQLIELQKEKENGLVMAYFQKVQTLLRFNKTAEAYQLAVIKKEELCSGNYDNCVGCGYLHRQLSSIMELMQDYQEGIRYLEMDCNKENVAVWYYKKARLQLKLEDTEGALNTTQSYIDAQFNKPAKLIEAYNNHGLIAREANQFEIAIKAFQTGIHLIDSTDLRASLKPTMLGNLGSCYMELGDFDQAYEFLLLDSKGSLEINELGSYINAEISLAKIERHRQLFNAAILRLERILHSYASKLSIKQKKEIYAQLIRLSHKSGDRSKHHHYSSLYIDLVENESQLAMDKYGELVKVHSANAVNHIKSQMASERKLMDQEMQLMKQEDKRRSLVTWLIISSLTLSLIIAVLLFFRYRSDQQKKSVIRETQLDLAKKEQEILELKVKKESQHVKELSLELSVKSDFANSLTEELAKLDQLSSADKNHIEQFIQTEMGIKSTRAELQEIMGDAGSKFHNALHAAHPNLTDTEIKLTVMIVLNLTNKEIAIKKNIAPGSVKIAKNRLKKKLNLSPEQSLLEYLQSLSTKD